MTAAAPASAPKPQANAPKAENVENTCIIKIQKKNGTGWDPAIVKEIEAFARCLVNAKEKKLSGRTVIHFVDGTSFLITYFAHENDYTFSLRKPLIQCGKCLMQTGSPTFHSGKEMLDKSTQCAGVDVSESEAQTDKIVIDLSCIY